MITPVFQVTSKRRMALVSVRFTTLAKYPFPMNHSSDTLACQRSIYFSEKVAHPSGLAYSSSRL